jgi:hypothetical protein
MMDIFRTEKRLKKLDSCPKFSKALAQSLLTNGRLFMFQGCAATLKGIESGVYQNWGIHHACVI